MCYYYYSQYTADIGILEENKCDGFCYVCDQTDYVMSTEKSRTYIMQPNLRVLVFHVRNVIIGERENDDAKFEASQSI